MAVVHTVSDGTVIRADPALVGSERRADDRRRRRTGGAMAGWGGR